MQYDAYDRATLDNQEWSVKGPCSRSTGAITGSSAQRELQMPRSVSIAVLVFAWMLAASNAFAQTHAVASGQQSQTWKWCKGPEAAVHDRAYGDKVVAACADIINSGRETQQNLALAYFYRAKAQSQLSRFPADERRADYSRAIELDPTNPKFFIGRGETYYDLKTVPGDRSEDEYRSAYLKAFYQWDLTPLDLTEPKRTEIKRLKENLDRAEAEMRDAEKRLESYRLDRQIADFTEAIRLDTAYARAFEQRGETHKAKGNNNRASGDYTEAFRLDPYFRSFMIDLLVELLDQRGDANSAKGDIDHAIADYNEALRLKPNGANILDRRGFAYLKLAQFDKAIADYDAALKINPKRAGSLFGRGTARLKKGNSGGNADIAAAIALRPDIAAEFARDRAR
jgi:Tfp pilus assembly protein PilF